MSHLILEGVSKSFDGTPVLQHIDLSVKEGEFVAILGFSGTGKTTLVNLLAGLVSPDSGAVTYSGQPITAPGPERGVVFQSYSLMPWATVRGNIALAVDEVFGAENKAKRKERVDAAIQMVGLSHAADRRPAELSGGMRQRVAVARALAMSPDTLLLDEPLSALDALTRAKLGDEIEAIWERDRKTVLLVTNDVDEAILLADRIIPLDPGASGEAATLGPSFPVDLIRPRDRTSVNEDPAFRLLRQAVTEHLIASGAERTAEAEELVAPTVVPVDFGSKRKAKLPKAYAEAAAGPEKNRYVEFFEVSKVYPTPKGPLTVVDGFNDIMPKGEFVTLIGHSGCGKSTVLSMAAGLNPISDGGIVLDGREVDAAGPDRAVVFQAPSLMPWMTARENVALGVDRVYPKATKGERAEVVDYYLARVGLTDAMDTPAHSLSNGMKQRVGIARAFALSPKLLLLDEPFGMLDSLTRWELQDVLMEVWARTKVTAICVTHDVDEAIMLADRVVMMTNGPRATIGNVMHVDLPRPRSRAAMLSHPDYYAYREELLEFLEAYEGGATPGPEQLTKMNELREARLARQARLAFVDAAE